LKVLSLNPVQNFEEKELTGDGFKNVTVDSQLSAGNEIIFVGILNRSMFWRMMPCWKPKRQK